MPAQSKADTVNPKDLMGAKKVALSAVSPVAIAHEACAMMDGEWKYGFRNWREKKVIARIYVDAAMRHIMQWFEGEEVAEDSGVHHLGHARACLGILLDAQETGNLIDDRAAGAITKTMERLSPWVVQRRKYHHAQQVKAEIADAGYRLTRIDGIDPADAVGTTTSYAVTQLSPSQKDYCSDPGDVH